MESGYTYLMSSLPSLQFGGQPPFPFDRFLKLCEGFISDEDMHMLRVIAQPAAVLQYAGKNAILIAWREYEHDLRNELVKIRASRLRQDPARHMRQRDGYIDTGITHIALHAHRQPVLLDAEHVLDEARWRRLEDLVLGHFFDIEALTVYGLKLTILLRWEAIRAADSQALLARVLSRGQ